MEIEKKYLVNRMPEKLEQYDRWEIEQCYLCAHPVIRVRRKNDQYLLTYKNRPGSQSSEETSSLCISQEVEVPLTREAYEHLKKKADGIWTFFMAAMTGSVWRKWSLVPFRKEWILHRRNGLAEMSAGTIIIQTVIWRWRR